MAKIAEATATSPTTYSVSYPPTRAGDSDVSYDYLRGLAKSGYEVRVKPYPGTMTAPHTIPAEQ